VPDRTPARTPTLIVYPVRLSPATIRKIRASAERRNARPTALARELIVSALDAEAHLTTVLSDWRSLAAELELSGQQNEADRIWACCEALDGTLKTLGLSDVSA
jgi:hypothetical protein